MTMAKRKNVRGADAVVMIEEGQSCYHHFLSQRFLLFQQRQIVPPLFLLSLLLVTSFLV